MLYVTNMLLQGLNLMVFPIFEDCVSDCTAVLPVTSFMFSEYPAVVDDTY